MINSVILNGFPSSPPEAVAVVSAKNESIILKKVIFK